MQINDIVFNLVSYSSHYEYCNFGWRCVLCFWRTTEKFVLQINILLPTAYLCFRTVNYKIILCGSKPEFT
jgi:hypothetical protein